MLESIEAMSLLTILEIVGPVLLAAGLIYGTVQWSRRRRGRTEAIREEATRRLYREGAKEEELEAELSPADAPADVRTPPRRTASTEAAGRDRRS
jgi:hypothetical protein